MSDFPGIPPLPLHISTMSEQGVRPSTTRPSIGSITWPVASTAFYYPIVLPWPYPVARVWWVNGSAVTSTNMDFGIYSESGARIYSSGSTAESGTSAVQYVDATDFILGPGVYYFALACSTITANCGGQGTTASTTVIQMRMQGVLQEASALPLPANMTPSAATNACWPYCGITRTASGF